MSNVQNPGKAELLAQIGKLSPEKRALLVKRLQEKKRTVTQAAIPVAARIGEETQFPLSPAQQRLWFLEQWKPGNHAYIQLFRFCFHGRLDVAALRTAWNALVARHEVLRTRFATRDGQPVQGALASFVPPFVLRDLAAAMTAADQSAEVAQIAWQESRRPFDLQAAPPVRALLLRLAAEEHVLLLVTHHIIIDGWSIGVLMTELESLYRAALDGAPLAARLPPLPVQYGDFSLWQHEWLRGEVLSKQLTYWRQTLQGPPPMLDLPLEPDPSHSRPPLQSYDGARVTLRLPQPLCEALKELSRREGVTLFMTMVATLQLLLYRYTGQTDIVIGTPIAGRNREELEGLIGFFANTICLRTDLSQNPSFRELLARVKDVAMGAYANQDVPFEKLVEDLHPERDLSRTPLFQVLFQNIDVADRPWTAPGVTMEQVEFDNGSAKFDLTLQVQEKPDGDIVCTAEYATALWKTTTAARFLDHYRRLLEAVVAPAPGGAEARIHTLPLLTAAEEATLVRGFNAARATYRSGQTIHGLVAEQAALHPEREAVSCGSVRLTYGELEARANQLAHVLIGEGIGPDRCVGVCLERSVELVVALLGVLKAGGAYVPLDPAYPAERMAHMLADARPDVLVTHQALLDRLPEPAGTTILCLDRDAGRWTCQPITAPTTATGPEHLAYVIFTSGSTGRPKGIEIAHDRVVHLIDTARPLLDAQRGARGEGSPLNDHPARAARGEGEARQARLDEGERESSPLNDVWTVFHSYGFDFSVWEIWNPLLHGGRLVVVPEETTQDFGLLYRLIVEESVAVLNLTPPALRRLVEARGLALEQGAGRDQIRLIVTGGDALPGEMLPALLAAWGEVPIWNFYGPTESTVWASLHRVDLADAARPLVPIGRPLPDIALYVLDRGGQPVPIGVTGELVLGGVGLARGYHRHPALTADRFVPDPLADRPGARRYRTGDLARHLASGEIEFLGRMDFQVKVRGFRIELGEIEAVLTEHPAVREAVVQARPDSRGETQLVAYVVLDPTLSALTLPNVAELRGHLRAHVPEYMVPPTILILPELPLTPNQKVDRKALPAPAAAAPQRGHVYVAPRETLELQLSHLWESVLHQRPIGIHDNFFELGGHSLLALEVFERIEAIFGRRLPMATLFQAPTVAELAAVLRDEGWKLPWISLVPIQAGGSRPPFFCVHGGGGHVIFLRPLVQRLGPEQPFYGIEPRIFAGLAPRATIEEMAADYLTEIRQLQPQGPYFLGGASYGGRVAYEMAQQLHAQGERVAFLAMFDTYGPHYLKPKPDITRLERMALEVAYRFEHHAQSLIWLDPGERVPYAREKLGRAVEEARDWVVDHTRRVVADVQQRMGWVSADVKAAQGFMTRALDRYEVKPYPGRLTLFRARRQPPGIVLDPYLGWGGLAQGGIDVLESPGYHAAMLAEPYVRFLVRLFQPALQSAQAHAEAERAARMEAAGMMRGGNGQAGRVR